MNQLLYVTVLSNKIGGGMSGLNRNFELLSKVPNLDIIPFKGTMQSGVEALFSVLLGGNFLLSKADEKKVLTIAHNNGTKVAFVEGTLNGRLVGKMNQNGIEVVCFAHNVESILYRERFRSNRKSFLAYLKYALAHRNERRSLKYATKLVALNERDSEMFYSLYNRRADSLIPVSAPSVHDPFSHTNNAEKYIFFVGSDFFPNNEGIYWFIINVLPYIHYELWIAGSCCSSIKKIPHGVSNKIKLLGIVEDLDPLYRNALCVVAPIFKGSGMKTKTIEAMSYGKSIFGTNECFEGIVGDFDKIGGLCNSSEEFITKMNDRIIKNNSYTLSLFEEKYSNEVVQHMFEKIFD